MPPLPTVQLSGATEGGVSYSVLTTQGINAVPYLELTDQYKERYGQEDQLSAVRSCLCMWEDRYRFKNDMLGTSIYKQGNVVGGVVTGIVRYAPEQHPEDPILYATDCDLAQAMGVPTPDRTNLIAALLSSPQYGKLSQRGASNMVSYNACHFLVSYGPRDWDVVADANVTPNTYGELNRYLARYYQTSAENQQIPGTGFVFVNPATGTPYSPTQQVAEPGIVTFQLIELNDIWKQVPAIPWAAIQACVGKVNTFQFDALDGNYQPGTLLCLAPKFRRYRSGAGDIVFDITYIFVFKPQGWNALYRPHLGGVLANPPGFEKIIAKDGVTPLIPSADFGTLFVLP